MPETLSRLFFGSKIGLLVDKTWGFALLCESLILDLPKISNQQKGTLFCVDASHRRARRGAGPSRLLASQGSGVANA